MNPRKAPQKHLRASALISFSWDGLPHMDNSDFWFRVRRQVLLEPLS